MPKLILVSIVLMAALLHSVVASNEYDRIKQNIKEWRMEANISKHRKDLIQELIDSYGVMCCEKCDNEFQLHNGAHFGNNIEECEKCYVMFCEDCGDYEGSPYPICCDCCEYTDSEEED